MITFGKRTEESVQTYFEKTQDPEIKKGLPGAAQTVEDALAMFHRAEAPDSTSYGATMILDGRYIGDIWCYSIDPNDTPGAMISYCIFEKELWGRGIATEALTRFLPMIAERFSLKSVGAFAYAEHTASIRVLTKCGFRAVETFSEDGVLSVYLEKTL